MVDYTAERRKTEREREREREKSFCMFFPITSPAAQYREREEVLCEK